MVIPLFLLLLTIAMADAVTDWSTLKARIASFDVWQGTAIVAALLLGWGLTAGRALRPIWFRPIVGFLIRQPISPWRWAAYLTPSIGIALMPVIGLAWLAPAGSSRSVHYLVFVMLAWPLVVGGSFSGRDALMIVPVAAGVCIAALAASAVFPLLWPLAIVAAALVIRFSVLPIRRQMFRVNPMFYAPLSGSGVIATLVRRDLRYLFRRQRRRLAEHYVWIGLCALLLLGFRVNGEQVGRDAFLSACALFSISMYRLYEILESLKLGLGKELMRRRWPVTSRLRAWALVALSTVLVGPGALLFLSIGSSMGIVNALVFLVFAAMTVAYASGLLSTLLLTQSSSNGFFLLALTAHFVAVLALDSGIYAVFAVAGIALAFRLTARGFDRFTLITERTSIDQLA